MGAEPQPTVPAAALATHEQRPEARREGTDERQQPAELNRTLGLWPIAAIIFVTLIYPDVTYNVLVGTEYSGTASLVVWTILAISSILAAMTIGELIGMFPSAGGAYEFYKQAFGRFPSFFVGWTLWIAGNLFTALYSVFAVEIIIPPDSVFVIGTIVLHGALLKNLVTILFIVLLNVIAFYGIEASARMLMILAVVAIVQTLAFIFPGSFMMNTSHFFPMMFSTGGLLITFFYTCETFFGWDSVAFLAEETKDAAKVIPRVLVNVTTVIAIINLLLAFIMIGVVGTNTELMPYQEFIMHVWDSPLVLFFINASMFLLLLGSTSSGVIGLPRLLMALGRDKLFIEQFSDIHPTRQTPYKAIILQTIITSVIVVLGGAEWDSLFALFVPISIIIYIGMFLLVPYFRWKRPDQPRPYKSPVGSVGAVFLALLYAMLLTVWAINDKGAIWELRVLGSFLLFSIPIYLTLTYFYDPDSLKATLGFFSRINLFLEDIFIPKRIRHEMIGFFRELKDKHVLEFGSGVGSLTMHIAEKVGKNGKVYALELSEDNTRILRARMEKKGHTHVQVIHDPHLMNRVHPDVKSVHVVMSINSLSYIQDINKVLREMHHLLPPDGQICFVEYIDMFYFLPNPKWLSNHDDIKKVFNDAGFNVTVKRRRGIFWKYIYIYGEKRTGKNVPYI